MARFDVGGLDDLSKDLASLASLPDEVLDGILDAEADVILQAQRSEIGSQWRGPYSQEISAKALKKGPVKKGKGGRSVSVYPQGTRTRGKKRIRNAEIAFIDEYGKRGQPGRPAIRTANEQAAGKATEAGEKVYHAYLDSKNL